MGSVSLLQGIFPTQGSDPRSPTLQADSLPAEPQGKPKKNINVTVHGSVSSPKMVVQFRSLIRFSFSLEGKECFINPVLPTGFLCLKLLGSDCCGAFPFYFDSRRENALQSNLTSDAVEEQLKSLPLCV